MTAYEIASFVINDDSVYDDFTERIIEKLQKLFSRGRYKPYMAHTLWLYVVDRAAQRYSEKHKRSACLDNRCRHEAAKLLAAVYTDEVKTMC